MARFHRILNGKTGEITVTPFTQAEEARADQWEVDQVIKASQEADPEFRVSKAFQPNDKDRAIFNAFFVHEKRIRALEGQPAITKAQLKKWFESQLD